MGEKKEYIERGALIAEYDRVHVGAPGGARKLMVDAPAADVVEVVRCGKCKFFFEDCCNHHENRIAYRVPDFGDHYVYAGRIKCEPDHFCGRGERKEQT